MPIPPGRAHSGMWSVPLHHVRAEVTGTALHETGYRSAPAAHRQDWGPFGSGSDQTSSVVIMGLNGSERAHKGLRETDTRDKVRDVPMMSDAAGIATGDSWLRNLLEAAQEGIWIVDTSGKATFANQRMAEIVGRPIQELMELSVLSLIPERSLDQALIPSTALTSVCAMSPHANSTGLVATMRP